MAKMKVNRRIKQKSGGNNAEREMIKAADGSDDIGVDNTEV